MENEIDDGGPAFPNPTTCATDGMTLRDYFAGQALAGMTANPFWDDADESEIAAGAYEHADAMLQQRKANPCTKAQ